MDERGESGGEDGRIGEEEESGDGTAGRYSEELAVSNVKTGEGIMANMVLLDSSGIILNLAIRG